MPGRGGIASEDGHGKRRRSLRGGRRPRLGGRRLAEPPRARPSSPPLPSAQPGGGGGGGGLRRRHCSLRCCPRFAALPHRSFLLCFSFLPLLSPSLSSSPPLPSSPSIPPFRGGGGWGGVSLGIIGPRRCRQSGRAGCPRLPAPPPSGGNGKDTHHAPLNLPPIPVSATPPRAVGSRGFPSGPAPVAGTESARRGSPCGQVLPPGVGTQRTQRCALTQGCRGALEGLIAICRRAAAAPGREVRGQLCWTFLTAGPPTLFEGLDPRPRAGLRSRPLPSRCRLCAAGVIRGAAATLSLSQPATAGAE
eukprot:XP_025000750.1 protein transport protein SEC31-like [Gallus gallus]